MNKWMAPYEIPKGQGLKLPLNIESSPKAEIMLRCAMCPGWSRLVTFEHKNKEWARHCAGARHNGRMKRRPSTRLRLLQDDNGRWRL